MSTVAEGLTSWRSLLRLPGKGLALEGRRIEYVERERERGRTRGGRSEEESEELAGLGFIAIDDRCNGLR